MFEKCLNIFWMKINLISIDLHDNQNRIKCKFILTRINIQNWILRTLNTLLSIK